MISALWTFCLLVLLSHQGYATVLEIENLFARIDQENSEIRVAKHALDYHEQSLRVSQSFLYPSLTLNASLNKSKEVNATSTSTTTSSDTPAPSETPTPSRPATLTNTGDGWNAQFSTNYPVFSHFGIDQSIKSSKLQIQSASYELSKQRALKRSQFIQALLEWQWLRGLQTPLAQAGKIIRRVKDHADQKSSILYSDLDRVELLQKETEIHYNTVKVHEGLKLVQSAMKDLLPSLAPKEGEEELDRLPKIAVYYPLPPADTLESAYTSKSLARKIHENDVRIAGGNYEVATWNKPWIPSVTLTGSYSKFGGYTGGKPDDTWSAGLLFSFNIFDGFYTQARRAQTHIGLETAEERLRLETSKRLVRLRAQTMKALVSQAEYKMKDSTVKRRRIELEQTEAKQKEGVGSELEVSAATLYLVKARFDALDALKNYQSATLEIAVELNEWDRVNIHDITN